MPNTPNLALPYPLASDPANVPSDILALATRLDNLASSGVFSKAPTRQVFTSGSGTYTTPAGCRAILVECVGGAGGGGGVPASASGTGTIGGAGGGGAYAASLIANPVATYAYAVGAGGNGGVAGSNAGSNGGDTTFGSSVVVAKAGVGGTAAIAAIASGALEGANGGQAASCVGDITADGGRGEGGLWSATAPIFVLAGGAGNGAGPYGGGVNGGRTVGGAATGNAGYAGKRYGGGGTGAVAIGSGAAANAGGNAAAGIVVITEYY